jgi:hypothetical protein
MIILILVFVSLLNAGQKSERAIVNKFEKIVQELYAFSDSAKTVQDCADIGVSVDEIEKEFAGYKDLLNRSLYPDDYTKTITKLRGRLIIRQKDLGIIETQFTYISELEVQVRELSGKVDSLTRENEKLTGDVQRLSARAAATRDSLQLVINKLRQNLRQRDDLIFSLLDSLFLQYDKNIASMNDIEKQSVYGKLERRNVLTNIKKSIDDNLKLLESTELTSSDYAELARQHRRFESQWKGVGPKLANIYLAGKQKKYEIAQIDSMLSRWSSEVDRNNWKALHSLLSKNGVVLKPFTNGNEFTTNFFDFVDIQIKNESQEPEDVRAKRFNTFNDNVWKNELEPSWLPMLVESGKLTAEQKKEIEEYVDGWHGSVAPTSWVVFAVIGILIVAIFWGLAIHLRKKSTIQT